MRAMEEPVLIEGLMRRDEAALRELIDRYGPAVFGTASRVLADRGIAEEVAQDTFVAMWRRPGAYDPERGSLRAFLCSMARNKAIDRIRREQVRRRARDELIAETRGSGVGREDERIVKMEQRSEINAALATLSDVQREAIVLAYFGGRTYREVASELGVPEGTAKTRLRDGLLKLKAHLGSDREVG